MTATRANKDAFVRQQLSAGYLYLVLDIHEMHEVILALNDGFACISYRNPWITNLPLCHLSFTIPNLKRPTMSLAMNPTCEPTCRKAGHRNLIWGLASF